MLYIMKCATKFTLEIDFYFCLKRARLSIEGLGAKKKEEKTIILSKEKYHKIKSEKQTH